MFGRRKTLKKAARRCKILSMEVKAETEERDGSMAHNVSPDIAETEINNPSTSPETKSPVKLLQHGFIPDL